MRRLEKGRETLQKSQKQREKHREELQHKGAKEQKLDRNVQEVSIQNVSLNIFSFYFTNEPFQKEYNNLLLPSPETPEKKLRFSFEQDEENSVISSPAGRSFPFRLSSSAEKQAGGPDSSISDSSSGSITLTSAAESSPVGERSIISPTNNQQDSSTPPEEPNIQDMMTNMKVSGGKKIKLKRRTKEPWRAIFPHLCYTWQDENLNDMCTVEVHLPSASVASEFHLELEVKKDSPHQFLIMKHRVSDIFLQQEAFEHFIDDCVDGVKDAASMSQARENCINAVKHKYSDAHDIEEKFCNMVMEVQLPFHCEDIFSLDDYQGNYPNTESKFRQFPAEDDDGEIVTAHVLIITLVTKSRLKPENVARRNTPQTFKRHGVITRNNNP